MALGSTGKSNLERGKVSADRQSEGGVARVRPGLADMMAGESREVSGVLYPFLPNDLVGGTIPYIPGTEEEAVWNAASQACGTEKVHYCYSLAEKRLWFLAVPSSALASNPNSWCPLAAALPGNSEFWDKETVYLYEQEGIASALRWDPETGRMQVFLGASRTLLPRVQSMDANFVTINPEIAEVVPWKNRALRTEKLSRATIRMLLLAGLTANLIIVLILVFNYISVNMLERNLEKVHEETDKATSDLMVNAYNAMQSDTIKHMVRIQEIVDRLAKDDGTLVRYEVKDGAVNWEALVPQAFADKYGTPVRLEGDGRVRIKNTQ